MHACSVGQHNWTQHSLNIRRANRGIRTADIRTSSSQNHVPRVSVLLPTTTQSQQDEFA
ncbi:hypothetical protein HBI38_072440 [Parastagonospora nodorum]|nr:hypothetical protein HBH61_080070 [Parastagonospora nodorum]KAH5165205.1 hypothetical protein HBI73_040540 [Parastagonospora nodorum]KAH5678764.1 hypothetical protein HBI21_087660 [Parastagonospora nodorum]KAH6273751.1 hypothetical protein HBI41_073670 [Parastagonospora nodorum]KAH6294120.1 hypothetical protein HBI40_065830 [Parastagonospora nodorum]